MQRAPPPPAVAFSFYLGESSCRCHCATQCCRPAVYSARKSNVPILQVPADTEVPHGSQRASPRHRNVQEVRVSAGRGHSSIHTGCGPWAQFDSLRVRHCGDSALSLPHFIPSGCYGDSAFPWLQGAGHESVGAGARLLRAEGGELPSSDHGGVGARGPPQPAAAAARRADARAQLHRHARCRQGNRVH